MREILGIVSTWAICGGGLLTVHAAEPARDYPYRPAPFAQVQLSDAFWAPRIETSRKATIPHCFRQCEETGRIDNFAVAGKLKPGKFRGIYFNDSDVYKVLEGAAYALAVAPDAELARCVDEVIAKIAAAQEPDGYLYTARTLMGPDYTPPGGKQRWSDLAGGHELYCLGHLYEAAAAHFQATGKRSLLDVAIKSADLVCRVFGPEGKRGVPGHEEVEIGLVKLYRVTGEQKYLRMAKFFLDERGRSEHRRLYGTYSQDHRPVVEQDEAVGHAVRAMYMYAGMADAAALTGDAAYVQALDRLWQDVVGKKMYLTGGIGSAGGHEGFGPAYDLPNLIAYCETCAAIAMALWNQRMFLLHGEGKYIDVLERTLYNGLISGVSLDGQQFFYPNPLESDGRHARSPWFSCACCPSNVARFVPSVPGYVYACSDEGVYVNLFVAGKAKLKTPGGTLTLTQQTRYPWDGKVKILVDPEKPGQETTIQVRIPGWARGEAVPTDLYRFLDQNAATAALQVNGVAADVEPVKGYVAIRRPWRAGDVIEMDLPMPVRRVVAHEKIADDRGKVALQRGPLVYCVEWPDVKDAQVVNLLLPDEAELSPEVRADLLGGVTVLRGKAQSLRRLDRRGEIGREEVDLVAIPYYAWAHRGRGDMAVWLARTDAAARPLPAPTLASTSRASASGGDVKALSDQREPRSSGDHANRFLHWWPRKGTLEWVQYDFPKPTQVSAIEVYWFDDTGRGECRLPKSWRLLYREGNEWKPVSNPSGYGCEPDKYNRTTFDPVTTGAMRIEVQLPERFSSGIHEWRAE